MIDILQHLPPRSPSRPRASKVRSTLHHAALMAFWTRSTVFQRRHTDPQFREGTRGCDHHRPRRCRILAAGRPMSTLLCQKTAGSRITTKILLFNSNATRGTRTPQLIRLTEHTTSFCGYSVGNGRRAHSAGKWLRCRTSRGSELPTKAILMEFLKLALTLNLSRRTNESTPDWRLSINVAECSYSFTSR